MSDEVRPEQIYEALFDDEAFANLPHLLARAAGGRSAVLQWSHADGETQALAYSYYSADYVAAYANGFVEYDLWLAAATRPENLNRTINGSEHLSLTAFERSVMYNDYSRAHGDDTFFSIGSAVTSSTGTGLITVGRGRLQSPFEAQDVARLDRLVHSARQVLRVRGELASARREAGRQRSTLATVGLCLLTVGSGGRVLDLNPAAERVLEDGLVFRIHKGRLQAVRPQNAEDLVVAIAQATRSAGPVGSTVLIRPSEGSLGIAVTLTPLTSGGAGAALLAFRPARSRLDLAPQLRQVYGLTRMEAELAVSLYEGLTQREHAEARGVLESTVRSQLKSLMAKMGGRRQAQIVAMIAHLPIAPELS